MFQAGMMVTINSTKDLSVSVGLFYLPLNKSAPESPIFSLPYMAKQIKVINLNHVYEICKYEYCYFLKAFFFIIIEIATLS